MNVFPSEIPEVLIVEPKIFGDGRGFFIETFHSGRYPQFGIEQPFVQDNWSRSIRGTLRGLHFQNPRPQGKLVMVTRGSAFDVAVDVRQDSKTFGQWVGFDLSEDNRRQIWIPPGFAHGFCVTSDVADVIYKCTDVYVPSAEVCIAWNDPDIGIRWPVSCPLLSKKDAAAPNLRELRRSKSLS